MGTLLYIQSIIRFVITINENLKQKQTGSKKLGHLNKLFDVAGQILITMICVLPTSSDGFTVLCTSSDAWYAANNTSACLPLILLSLIINTMLEKQLHQPKKLQNRSKPFTLLAPTTIVCPITATQPSIWTPRSLNVNKKPQVMDCLKACVTQQMYKLTFSLNHHF